MEAGETFDHIDLATLDSLLQEYSRTVPEKLTTLDVQRYNDIPAAVKKQADNFSLSKEQVATLVNWKLSHGKWRPTLQGLVQRNADSLVQDQTREAFKAFSSGVKSPDQAKQAVNTLSKLQGIGPATASLLLSVFDPETAPFFSDELFRWCFHEDIKGKGWDREIKYNVKEYVELYVEVGMLRERLKKSFGRDIAAVAIEKVAYVLGKKAAGSVTSSNGKKRKAETALGSTPRKDRVTVESEEYDGAKPGRTVKAPQSNSQLKSSTKTTRGPSKREASIVATSRLKRAKT